jgi:hypothetical protein
LHHCDSVELELARVAVLWNPGTPEGEVQRQRLDAAALAMRVKLRFFGVRHPGELQSVFADIERERFDALLVSQLVADALMMAVWRRGKPVELLHHSDQGVNYRARLSSSGHD